MCGSGGGCCKWWTKQNRTVSSWTLLLPDQLRVSINCERKMVWRQKITGAKSWSPRSTQNGVERIKCCTIVVQASTTGYNCTHTRPIVSGYNYTDTIHLVSGYSMYSYQVFLSGYNFTIPVLLYLGKIVLIQDLLYLGTNCSPKASCIWVQLVLIPGLLYLGTILIIPVLLYLGKSYSYKACCIWVQLTHLRSLVSGYSLYSYQELSWVKIVIIQDLLYLGTTYSPQNWVERIKCCTIVMQQHQASCIWVQLVLIPGLLFIWIQLVLIEIILVLVGLFVFCCGEENSIWQHGWTRYSTVTRVMYIQYMPKYGLRGRLSAVDLIFSVRQTVDIFDFNRHVSSVFGICLTNILCREDETCGWSDWRLFVVPRWREGSTVVLWFLWCLQPEHRPGDVVWRGGASWIYGLWCYLKCCIVQYFRGNLVCTLLLVTKSRP